MTALLGRVASPRPGLGSSAADVLPAVRRFGSDLDRPDARIERGSDGVLHGEPSGLLSLDSATPGTHGLAQVQQLVFIHGGKYATSMWLVSGTLMCHTDVAVGTHINVAFFGGKRMGDRHDRPKGRSCSHRRYQLTCQEYEQLFDRAYDRCEICQNHLVGLVVDHDPFVGDWAVRGLLCNRCNSNLHRLEGAAVDRYMSNTWYRTTLLNGDATATRPTEPAGPVWDPHGRKWVRRGGGWQRQMGGGYWHPGAMSWPDLYKRFGPRLQLS